ncbi:MAG: hypothetical protein CMN05_12665 [Roseibacillus sp.]|nr:hypothetical protein [Roseibacillus sp.]MBP34048.1 hypothetical protein [Roseibacillus sp.]
MTLSTRNNRSDLILLLQGTSADQPSPAKETNKREAAEGQNPTAKHNPYFSGIFVRIRTVPLRSPSRISSNRSAG